MNLWQWLHRWLGTRPRRKLHWRIGIFQWLLWQMWPHPESWTWQAIRGIRTRRTPHAAHKTPRLRRLKIAILDPDCDHGNFEYLDFKRDLTTWQTRLEINTEWKYNIGEGVMAAWGLKGEKAVEFESNSQSVLLWTSGLCLNNTWSMSIMTTEVKWSLTIFGKYGYILPAAHSGTHPIVREQLKSWWSGCGQNLSGIVSAGGSLITREVRNNISIYLPVK